MQCPPCYRPMKMIDYMDTRDELPLVWIKGWRCDHCGFAINPLGELNRRFLSSMSTSAAKRQGLD
jgi:C4-type Zn-finger protein